MILDLDSFSVLVDFLNDDINFILYLKMNDIRPRNKEIEYDNIDWDYVSNDDDLSFEVMEAFPDKLNWYAVTQNYKYKCMISSFEFFDRMDEHIDWNLISSKMRLGINDDYEFYERYADKLNWLKISRYANMTEDFIQKFENELDWGILCKCQGLTRWLLDTYSHKLVFSQLKYNNVIPRALLIEYLPEEDEEEVEEKMDVDEAEESDDSI